MNMLPEVGNWVCNWRTTQFMARREMFNCTKPFEKNCNLQVSNKEKGIFMYLSRLGLKEQLLESPRFDERKNMFSLLNQSIDIWPWGDQQKVFVLSN